MKSAVQEMSRMRTLQLMVFIRSLGYWSLGFRRFRVQGLEVWDLGSQKKHPANYLLTLEWEVCSWGVGILYDKYMKVINPLPLIYNVNPPPPPNIKYSQYHKMYQILGMFNIRGRRFKIRGRGLQRDIPHTPT